MAYNGGNKYYADTFTKSACLGTGDFAESSSPPITKLSRAEGCQKGSQYLNLWMYVIHEMEEAIEDCLESVSPSTHWDESIAYFTGSTTLLNPTTTAGLGVFQYGLGEKKCPLFKTCVLTGDNTLLYKSAVNQKVFALFSQGSNYQKAGQCANLVTTKEAIVKQMTVPLFQGVMQYLYLSKTTGLEKAKAELWSFASSLLPLINKYSPTVAATLKNNAYIKNAVTVPDGYQAVKASLESVYGAIGISCSDVGGWVDLSTSTGYATGMDPCSDNVIVGYSASNDVTQHLRLDLDQTALNAAAQKYDFDTAYAAYSKGKTSHTPHALHDMPERALSCTYCMRRRFTSFSSDLKIVNDFLHP